MYFMQGWVVCPPSDEDSEFSYGVKQDRENYRFALACGACGDLIEENPKSISTPARCSFCFKTFSISPLDGWRGEDKPFQLYWGMFSWDMVEENMQTWLDYYFNLKRGGEVVISFDGTDWKSYLDRDKY